MSQDFTDNVYDSSFNVLTTMENVEKNFLALKSLFSGTSAPSNTVEGMPWLYTDGSTYATLRIRNEDDSAWQDVWDMLNNKPVITNLSNEITAAMIAAALKSPAATVEGLRTIGTGALEACAGNDSRLSDNRMPIDMTAGDLNLGSNTDLVNENGTSYVLKKSVTVGLAGTYRIAFNLKSGATAGYAYGMIYRNGTAVGTERSRSQTTYESWSEDISGWSAGDSCQLYLRTNQLNNPASNSSLSISGSYRIGS